MSTTPTPPSSYIQTSEIPHTDKGYICPECGARHPSKMAVGIHREKKHGIPSDWKKGMQGYRTATGNSVKGTPAKSANASTTSRVPIKTSDVRFLHGGYKCPECGQKFDERRQLGAHRKTRHGVAGTAVSSLAHAKRQETAQLKADEHGVILTSSIRAVNGKYPCPECGLAYSTKPNLGYHRKKEHGVTGQYSFRREKTNGVDHHAEPHPANGASTAQSVPPNGQRIGRPRKGQWTDEALAGFVFAHVVSLIQDACRGNPNAIAGVTQRVSELLSIEVSGTAQRAQHLGLSGNLS